METMGYRGLRGSGSVAATIVAAAAVLPLFAERQAFERYQSVVDRQMFGEPPPGFDPTKPPSEVSAKEERAKEAELTKEQEQVKSAVHFSVINVTPAGDTAVGFTDNSDSKNPKHYYLKVGETRDGWTVKEADALKASMTIAKGEIEVSLTLGGNSASGGGTTKAGSNGGRAAAAPGGGRTGSRLSSGLLGGRGPGSLRERRALREQQRAAEAKAAEEAKAKAAAQEAQREAELAAEKAEREKEREEQRAQLLQIQEELKKAREAKDKARQEESAKDANEAAVDN